MKLQDIFDQLKAGEFSQLSIGGENQGVINENNYTPVIAHINMGLTAIYRRFSLKEGKVVLSLQDGQRTYPLKSEYAVTNVGSTQPVRFIQDDIYNPFKDDIHKIERVLTDAGVELALNDVNNPLACTTPNMTTLTVPEIVVAPTSQTPEWLRTSTLNVFYRANHPMVPAPEDVFVPSDVDIELPYSHLDALLYFVASRVHNPIGMSGEFHAGNNYAKKYEMVCQELERQNMRIDVGTQNTKLHQKGFV